MQRVTVKERLKSKSLKRVFKASGSQLVGHDPNVYISTIYIVIMYTHLKDCKEHLFSFSVMQLSNQPMTSQLLQCI